MPLEFEHRELLVMILIEYIRYLAQDMKIKTLKENEQAELLHKMSKALELLEGFNDR